MFSGESVSDTLAAVRKTDPDWSHLPPETPPPRVWQGIDRRTGGARRAETGWRAWLKPALGFAFGVVATIGPFDSDALALLPLEEAGLDGRRRPETLTLEEFGRLADAYAAPR